MSRDEAESHLEKEKNGTYLIRYFLFYYNKQID